MCWLISVDIATCCGTKHESHLKFSNKNNFLEETTGSSRQVDSTKPNWYRFVHECLFGFMTYFSNQRYLAKVFTPLGFYFLHYKKTLVMFLLVKQNILI